MNNFQSGQINFLSAVRTTEKVCRDYGFTGNALERTNQRIAADIRTQFLMTNLTIECQKKVGSKPLNNAIQQMVRNVVLGGNRDEY